MNLLKKYYERDYLKENTEIVRQLSMVLPSHICSENYENINIVDPNLTHSVILAKPDDKHLSVAQAANIRSVLWGCSVNTSSSLSPQGTQ